MNKSVTCDLAIIGAGAGGLSLAAGIAQLGLSVILIEKGKMGGDCLNYGCIPSKSLIASAKNYWQANHSQHLGLVDNHSILDFKQVMSHVHQVIKTLAVHDSVERFESLGVQVIRDTGHFIDEDTVVAGNFQIKAKRFVIASGSSAAVPPIPGINKIPFYTNETIFNLTELPEHLLVIGGGPVGCELAQAFAMLGSRVTLVESSHLLNNDDPDAVAIVRKSLIEKGVCLLEEATIQTMEAKVQKRIRLLVNCPREESTVIEGSHLLIATGRKPNIADLGCEQARIDYNKKGIIVDKRLRTSNKRVFAIGDAAGGLQFTHVANEHAGVVLRQIAFKLRTSFCDKTIPRVTYTSPELAQVGLSEKQVKASGDNSVVLKLEYSANDRAQTSQQTQGFIKVIVNKKGVILGATIVGESAGELIYPWVMAITQGKSLRVFTDSIVPYPTLNELNKRIAGQFYAPKLFSTKVKKLVRFLSYF